EALREFAARGADVRYGDFNEPGSLGEAFAGGGRMLLISTDAIGYRVPQHRAAIDAAVAAGVGHVVYTSHPNPVAGNPIGPVATEHGETEEMLHASGLAWTVLRFGSFAELQVQPAALAVAAGRPIARAVADFGRAVREGYFDVVDPTFETLSGRPPMSLREVLIPHRGDLLQVA